MKQEPDFTDTIQAALRAAAERQTSTAMKNEELIKEIEKMRNDFARERRIYLKAIGEIIRHFVPNEEQQEAVVADFHKMIQKDSDKPSPEPPA